MIIQAKITFFATDRDFMTWGGESTRHEMCFAFLYVYPKTDLKMCITQWTTDDFIDFWTTSAENGWATIDDPDDFNTWDYDVSDPEALEYYREFWTRPQRDIGCIGDRNYTYSVESIHVPIFEECVDVDYCGEANFTENICTPANFMAGDSSQFVWDS